VTTSLKVREITEILVKVNALIAEDLFKHTTFPVNVLVRARKELLDVLYEYSTEFNKEAGKNGLQG